MKRLVLVLTILFFSSLTIKAQQGFYMGAEGGLMNTWIANQFAYGDSEMEYEATFGLLGGVLIGYNFTPNLGLMIGGRYIDMGQHYDDRVRAIQTKRTIDLDYIQVPILFKYTSGQGTVKFTTEGGLVYGRLLSAEFTQVGGTELARIVSDDGEVFDSNNDLIKINNPIDFSSRFKENDLGIEFGIGAQISLSKQTFLEPGIKFMYGLSNIHTDEAIAAHPGYDGPSKNFFGGINVKIYHVFRSQMARVRQY